MGSCHCNSRLGRPDSIMVCLRLWVWEKLTFMVPAETLCRGDEYTTDEKKGNALRTLHGVYTIWFNFNRAYHVYLCSPLAGGYFCNCTHASGTRFFDLSQSTLKIEAHGPTGPFCLFDWCKKVWAVKDENQRETKLWCSKVPVLLS